jgi:hypothetical protein
MNLSSIFSDSNTGAGAGGLGAFDSTPPAPEFAPLPAGVYSARVLKGEFTTTKAGADAYRLQFKIAEGEHVGKTVIRTWTFSPKALPYTKRDLASFGLTSSAKLLAPFPEPGREYLVRLVVVLQRDDTGIERNDIKKIDIIRVDESPTAAPPAPPTAGPTTAGPSASELPPELRRFGLGKGEGGNR